MSVVINDNAAAERLHCLHKKRAAKDWRGVYENLCWLPTYRLIVKDDGKEYRNKERSEGSFGEGTGRYQP
jgi:hypothetical protein